jgi:hypothetical protein
MHASGREALRDCSRVRALARSGGRGATRFRSQASAPQPVGALLVVRESTCGARVIASGVWEPRSRHLVSAGKTCVDVGTSISPATPPVLLRAASRSGGNASHDPLGCKHRRESGSLRPGARLLLLVRSGSAARSRSRGAGRLLSCCRPSRRDDRNATIAITRSPWTPSPLVERSSYDRDADAAVVRGRSRTRWVTTMSARDSPRVATTPSTNPPLPVDA